MDVLTCLPNFVSLDFLSLVLCAAGRAPTDSPQDNIRNVGQSAFFSSLSWQGMQPGSAKAHLLRTRQTTFFSALTGAAGQAEGSDCNASFPLDHSVLLVTPLCCNQWELISPQPPLQSLLLVLNMTIIDIILVQSFD